MTLDEIKNVIEILPIDETNTLRNLYIKQFIDIEKKGYKENIADRKLFSDGYCYTGYLWDYLNDYHRITMQTLLAELSSKKYVLVFWDIHSCDRIFIEDYWKFGKDTVIKISTNLLEQALNFLPEDVYIFNYDFSWTYITTHEDDGKRRICLKVE